MNLKCLLLLFSVFNTTFGVETTVHLSTDLASSVCQQQQAFQDTEFLQPPVTAQPQSETTTECGWLTIPKNSPGAQQEISKRLCEELESQSQGNAAIASPRVLGGTVTKKQEFPSLCAVWKLQKPGSFDNWTFFSAGSVLSSEWVMTTASRFKTEIRPEYFAVETGSYNISDYSKPAQLTFIDKIIFHPKYKRGKLGLGHNIVLLHVVEALFFNNNTQPAILPDADYEPSGGVTVVGRGKIPGFNTRPLDVPFKANFTILPKENCSRAVDRFNPANVSDTIFCARTKEEQSKNICPDDTGGLVLAYEENSTVPVQVGLIGYNEEKLLNESEWRLNCQDLDAPFTITHLAKLLDWIFMTTGIGVSSDQNQK